MTLFKTSKKSSDKKSGGGIFDPSHDFVRFEGADGKSVLVPRGSMSDEDWKALVAKSTQKATFKEAKVGKQVIKSPSGTYEAEPLVIKPGGPTEDPGTGPWDPSFVEPVRGASAGPRPPPSAASLEMPPVEEPPPPGTWDAPPLTVKPGGPTEDPGTGPWDPSFVEPVKEFVEPNVQKLGSSPPPSKTSVISDIANSPAVQGFGAGFKKGLLHPLDTARELGAVALGPSPGAQLQQLTDAGKKGLPSPAELAKTPSGPPPASPTDTPSTSNSNSLSVSVRGGPGGSPPRGTNQLDQAQRDFLAGQERQQQVADKTARDQLLAREEHARKMREFEVRQNEEKLSQRKAEDDLNNAYRTTLDELGKKMQIDPNHFWESKSTGQQVGIAIGAFLAGIGGRSPAALIDSMVQQDIAVQRENFNLAREGLKGKLAGLDNMYGKLRQRGLDDREAAAATRASINEGLARQMEGIAEQSAPGELQAKAQLALAEFRANKVRAEEELTTLRFNRWAKTQELQNQRIAFAMSAAESAAKAKEKKDKVAATLLKEQMQFEDMLANVDAMVADASGGMIERGLTAGATKLPLGGLVDPDRKAKGRDFAQRAFTRMTELAKSALQKHEFEILKDMVPTEVTAYDDPTPTLMKMRDFIVKARDRRAEFYKGGGLPETGPVPEESGAGE